MVVAVSETYTHNSPKKEKQNLKEKELERVILKLMKKNGIDPKKAERTEDGRLELKETPNLKLHSLMLQAEELGLDLKLTKQMVIEIN